MGGPLEGMRVVELAAEHAAFAGKLLADLGAEVVVVEPPGGHRTRSFEPFLDDISGEERSLWWWHYNTSKRGVVLDLDDDIDRGTFGRLVHTADVVLEGERPGTLGRLGIDYPDLRPAHPRLIWCAITPFGRTGPRHDDAFTDLTMLAGGGPVWSCGYDDHEKPPIRGGGNQGYQTACVHAAMAILTAFLSRARTGRGQFIDVNMHAAANVSTEGATVRYLVSGLTVQRQTGRHAMPHVTGPTMAPSADGRLVHTGVPPRNAAEMRKLLRWIDDLELRDEFPEWIFVEQGAEHPGPITEMEREPEVQAMFGAGRDALILIASKLPARDFFVEAQHRGLSCGVVYSPEEVLDDPHFVARGFDVQVEHPELGRSFRYPNVPFKLSATPGNVRRAPLLGEHDDEILGALRPRRDADEGSGRAVP
jgi:crotonobetainyl-CoA:carnitine CoA-transferase CaiB-like acyl-CoA transferase